MGATRVGDDTVDAAAIGVVAETIDVTGLGVEGSGRVEVDVDMGGTARLTGLEPGD